MQSVHMLVVQPKLPDGATLSLVYTVDTAAEQTVVLKSDTEIVAPLNSTFTYHTQLNHGNVTLKASATASFTVLAVSPTVSFTVTSVDPETP